MGGGTSGSTELGGRCRRCNSKEVHRVASLQARLGNRARKLCCSCSPSVVYTDTRSLCLAWPYFPFLSFSLHLPLLSFLFASMAMHHAHQTLTRHMRERRHPREKGFICFVLSRCIFLFFLICSRPFPKALLTFSLMFVVCCFIILPRIITTL